MRITYHSIIKKAKAFVIHISKACEWFASRNKLFIFINALSLSRIPLSIAFYIIFATDNHNVFASSILFLVIVGTDMLDGRLARKYQMETNIGAILDVCADFCFVLIANYALYQAGLVPLWILAVILLKFVEFCLTSYCFPQAKKQGKSLLFDKFGRWSAILLYMIPVLPLWFTKSVFSNISNILFLVILSFSILSTMNRLYAIGISQIKAQELDL